MLNNYHNLYIILTYIKQLSSCVWLLLYHFSVFVFGSTVHYVSFGCTSQKIPIIFLKINVNCLVFIMGMLLILYEAGPAVILVYLVQQSSRWKSEHTLPPARLLI